MMPEVQSSIMLHGGALILLWEIMCYLTLREVFKSKTSTEIQYQCLAFCESKTIANEYWCCRWLILIENLKIIELMDCSHGEILKR